MGTVLRTGGLRIVIYTTDHDPPHVHVFGDAETKIILGNSAIETTVLFSASRKRNEIRRAEAAVKANHAFLLARWRLIHG